MDTKAAVSINPATGDKIGEYARLSLAEAKLLVLLRNKRKPKLSYSKAVSQAN